MMKTPKQIRRFLHRQSWYLRYLYYVLREEDSSFRDKVMLIRGHIGLGTVATAFDWRATAQGYMYWKAVNDAFTSWFNQ